MSFLMMACDLSVSAIFQIWLSTLTSDDIVVYTVDLAVFNWEIISDLRCTDKTIMLDEEGKTEVTHIRALIA
ncbi:hypothetical protein PanWU01x14_040970 [Parasponia andersonii]|uniref:Uncharacterized protein n=1 Tax=Parasponia andersonii TaxID=3476 RepID=A0A2P5DQ90_PARAD|nr:hypothetical protein PanWU01x14_040970 [Parasponia andersonii]